ncbi:uncharacterized protein LOC129750506 [Uranotaenia lowii]|uniref:uncharacterized protein LOC129750506 n=1 Tax=Uranotaenia lowii TaxID=190385 RepID=UPI00247910D0|nr:uncharacterized protein LOC129750506 [Uranotaenia lowii]
MKTVLVLVAVLSVVVSGAIYSPIQQEKIRKIADPCASEQNIPLAESDYKRAFDGGELFEDESFSKKMAKCFLEKIDALSADGVISGKMVVEFFADGKTPAPLVELAEKCVSSAEGETSDDRALTFYRCFSKGKSASI